MNDVAYDEKKEDKGKVKRILSVSGCDGFYYSLQGDDPLLKGQFVFEKEEHFPGPQPRTFFRVGLRPRKESVCNPEA